MIAPQPMVGALFFETHRVCVGIFRGDTSQISLLEIEKIANTECYTTLTSNP